MSNITGNEPTTARVNHPNAEPVPEWSGTSYAWKQAWMAHWIGFAIVYFTMAIFCVARLHKSRKRSQQIARNLSYSVYSLVLTFGLSRGLFLVLFPYELKPNFDVEIPISLVRVLHGIGYPSLTASFALIYISFNDAVKGKITNSKLRSVKFLIVVIAVHFSVVLIAAVLTALVMNTYFMFLLCQCYFQVMVIIILATIAHSGNKVIQEAKTSHNALRGIDQNYKGTAANASNIMAKKGLVKVRNVMILTAIVCCSVTAVLIYSTVLAGKLVAGSLDSLAAWPWLAYQSAFRLADIAMAGTVLFAIAPLRRNGGKKNLMAFLKGKIRKDLSGTDSYSMATASTNNK